MRILELHLRAFGAFTDHVLDLSGGQQGLHLVYGPNEAGKSTSLRALRSFFYGIETRSSDNFVHPHPKMRIGAKLQTADGDILELVRRKGNRNTLRDADDAKAVSESVLSSLLGGIDEATFTQRYGLGYEDLVRGGREIVAGGGDLGQSLFAAASGAANLKAVQAQLSGEAEELFLPSARIRKINKSVAEYNELQSQIKSLLLPTVTWRDHDKALREAIEQRDAIRQQVSVLTVRLQDLQRVRDAIPLAAKRAQLQAALAPVANAPTLADDFSEKRREAVTALDVAARSRKSQQERLDQITKELEGIAAPTDILQHRQTIGHLQQRLGSHLKAMDDRRLRVAERKTAIAAATSALKDLGRADLSIDQADQLRIKPQERVRIQNLGIEKSKLVERVSHAQATLDELREQRQTVATQLEDFPPCQSIAALSQAISAARDAGPLDKRLSELNSQQEASAGEIARQLARLQGYSGDVDELERLQLPSEETIDRFDQTLTDARQSLTALQDKFEALEEESRQLEEQLTSLQQGHDVPTESDLLSARRLRDSGWQLIQRQLSGENVSAEQIQKFTQAFASEDDLSQAYSKAVTQADALADQLRREAS